MPDMGGEVHLGRLEGVLVGDPDVKLQAQRGARTPSASERRRQRREAGGRAHMEGAALVGSPGGPCAVLGESV